MFSEGLELFIIYSRVKFVSKITITKKTMETKNEETQKEGPEKDAKLTSESGESKNEKKSIWQWIVGGFILLLALIFIFSHFLAGLVLLIVSCLVFPPFVNFIEKKLNIKLTKKVRNISVVIGIILAFFLVGAGGEKYEIKIYQSDNVDDKEVVSSEKILIEAVNNFQDAQLSTVALLAVRFETADREKYLVYIDEVQEKWEKVEKDIEKLEEIEKKAGDVPAKPITEHKIFNSTLAKNEASSEKMPESIEFGDGFENNGNEVLVGEVDRKVYENVFDEAFAFKRAGLSKTANQYLRKQLKTTVEGAQEALEDHRKVIELGESTMDDYYASASNTAQKIAYTSKVTLYVLGSVASFGSAAAATSGVGVITGYIVAAAGTAISAADVALDVAEGASVVSTGKGLNAYKKDKLMLGKMSEIHAIFNLAQIVKYGGGIRFDQDDFTNANNAIGVYNMEDVGQNLSLSLEKDVFEVRVGNDAKIPKGKSLDEIIKKIRNPEFDYNPISVSVDEDGNLSFSNEEGKTIANEVIGDCQNGEGGDIGSENLKRYWPECLDKKNSCQGVENVCIYKGHCICKEGFYATALDSEGPILDCVTEEDWFRRLKIQLGGLNSGLSGEESGVSPEDQEFLDNIEKNHPKQLERAQKAKSCDL